MASDLTAPLVPGASSIGEVIGRATQAAAIQSAQILSAARNIAADRQRAGEMAADAVVRMRLEDFQKEQFRQKKSIEDAQLGISLAANRRAELRAPLERGLLEAEIEQAPLRTALIGAQLTGATLGNAFNAARLTEFPEDLRRRREREDVAFGSANLDYLNAQEESDRLAIAKNDLESIAGMMMSTNTGEDLSYNLSRLEQMSTPGSGSSVLTDPGAAKIYNMAVEKLAPNDEIRERLKIPDPLISALQPETNRGFKEIEAERIRINNERTAREGAADAKINALKAERKSIESDSSKAGKARKAELDGFIQTAETEKSEMLKDVADKLEQLNISNGFLSGGSRDIDTPFFDTDEDWLLQGIE